MAIKPLKSIKFPELPDTYTIPQVDATPTQGSTNAVSSGGVYNAIHDTDTTLTQSGQAADSKVVGDKITYLGNEVNYFNGGSVNLLDPSEFIEGKYLVNGGGLSDNSRLTASGFFKVEENTTYYLYRSDTYDVRVCFYTDNSIEGYIYRSLIDVTSSTPTFTTPATAKYARISTNKNMILDMGIYVTDIRYYVPYRILLANDIGIDNQLDPTLTQSGQAADSKAVGDEFNNIREIINNNKTVIDNTLTQSGQAADAKETGDKITSLKSGLNEFNGGSINLLNPADFQQGKYIVAGGGLDDNANLTASGFFPVDENTTYYMFRSDTYSVRVAYYTSNSVGSFISMDSAISASTPSFTAPANAKYARLSTNKNMILDMGVYKTDIGYYIPHQIMLNSGVSIANQIDSTLVDSKKAPPADVVGEIKKHVVFPEKCIKYGDSGMIVDERLDLTTGKIVTNSSGQTRTDFIPVAVGDYLQTCAIRDICLYNDQFEYLGYINLWSSSGNVTPPTSWSGNYRSNIVQIEAIDDINPSYIRCWGVYNQYPPAISFLDGNPYEVLNLGDSIFGNNEKPWDLGTYIQNITGLKSANCGYGGTTARVIPSGNMSPLGLPSIVDCIVAGDFSALQTPAYWASVNEYMYAVPTLLFPMIDFSKIKIITIAYGTNDWNSNTPLDNTENRLDTSTYCGGLRYAIEHLQTKYPNIIMLFSPIYRYWSDSSDYSTVDRDSDSRTNTLGLKLTDYVDAMKSVADEYHLPYFDNYRNIGLNRYTAPTWLRDGTHLNRERGVEKLGHRVAREVETVY